MIAIAQVVGGDTVIGQALLYVAPTVAVLFGAAMYQIRRQAQWYSDRMDVRRERAGIERARATIQRQMDSNHISEARKAELLKLLEDLDHSEVQVELSKIQILDQRRHRIP
ncbi:hypothetical protein [Micromonospora sp. CPCC 205558]|uniref:hypothetical protein n=1 Tax=Micromonospora sp. CPCC 205558 TaxID=3122403 RepID=UPI002FEEFF64